MDSTLASRPCRATDEKICETVERRANLAFSCRTVSPVHDVDIVSTCIVDPYAYNGRGRGIRLGLAQSKRHAGKGARAPATEPARARARRRRIGFARVAIPATLWATACGDGATGPNSENRAPLANGTIPERIAAVGEVVAVNVAGRFTDPDGDSLSYAAYSSDPAVASVSMNGGVANVTAVAQGSATVSVTARDPGGLSARLDFSVSVPNRAPAVAGAVPEQSAFVGATVPVDVAPHFSDPDGDPLTYAASSSDPAVVSVSMDGSVANLVASAQGSATVSVTARDPGGLSARLDFSVSVPNRAPAAAGDAPELSAFVGATVPVDMALHLADPDGDPLTYAASSSDPAVVSVFMDGSVANLVASAQGSAVVSVSATDPEGLSARLDFSVAVPNRAPAAADSVPERSVFVSATTSVDMALHFSDPDGDPLTYAASSSDPAVVSVSMDGSVANLAASAQGSAVVSVSATDPGGLSARLDFSVAVPNRAPAAADSVPDPSVVVGATLPVDVAPHFADPDGDPLTYAASSSDPAVVSVSMDGSVANLVASAQGSATVSVTATDPGGLSARLDFPVRATEPNEAPVAEGSVPDLSVFAGETARVDAAPHFADPDGDPLTYAASSSIAAVAEVSVSGSVVSVEALAPGASVVSVTATDPGGLSAHLDFAVSVPNRAPAAAGSVPDLSAPLGTTVAVDMEPYFVDPDGDTLTYAASSSDSAVVSVSMDGSVANVTGAARGSATVSVAATDPEGLSARLDFAVTVGGRATVRNRAPVAVGAVPARFVFAGTATSVDMAPYFSDPDGDPLTYAASSSDAQVASISVSGSAVSVQGLAPGAAVVSVTATDPGGLSANASFSATVRSKTQTGTAVTISGVVPAVLIEGRQATISGSGFSPTAAGNQVFLAGRGARVTAATGTSLTFEVPQSDCLPARREELLVTTGSGSDARTVGVAPLTRQELANANLSRGEYRWTRAGSGCLHLPSGGAGVEYLIGVVSTSESASSLTGVTVTGAPGDATVAAAVADERLATPRWTDAEGTGSTAEGPVAAFAEGPIRSARAFVGGAPGAAPPVADAWTEEWARAHSEIVEGDRALLREWKRDARRPFASRTARSLPAVGDTLSLNIPRSPQSCTVAEARVKAVVRVVGDNAIWLDDVDNSVASFTDQQLEDLDAFYSANVKSVHDDYFGGLSDIDDNDRFMVLITQEMNRLGIGGRVSWNDLRSRSQCATSNEAEIFYGKMPDSNAARAGLLAWYPRLIAHEVTHLVQSNAHVTGTGPLKPFWEWEAGAVLAEMLVGHRVLGHGSGEELGWGAMFPWSKGSVWYVDTFGDMGKFLGWNGSRANPRIIAGAPEECGWIARPRDGNAMPCALGARAIYGVPSMVFRYAMDRWGGGYSGGEGGLVRRLTYAPTQGFASLTDVSPGRSWPAERILADFYIALWTDIQGWTAPGMTTWNLDEILDNYVPVALRIHQTSSSFSPRIEGHRVKGGSNLYLHWTPSGAFEPTSVKVAAAGGGRLPGHIAMWGLRVR